jgi:hypothetical protein
MSTSVRLSILLAVFGLGLTAGAEEPKKAAPASVNELSMEVAALETMRLFNFTPRQLEQIRKVAKETSDEAGARQAAVASDSFRLTLAKLHGALAKADDKQIDKLQDQLDELREKEQPDLDDGVEITDAAREHAPALVRSLNAGQIAGYLAGYSDAIPDPREMLLEALVKARGLDDKAWKQFRDEVPGNIASLVAGLDVEKAAQLTDAIVQLLIQARGMKDDEFKKERPDLEKTAQATLGNIGPFEVLQHVVEQGMAELLSNPRLAAALAARFAK